MVQVVALSYFTC